MIHISSNPYTPEQIEQLKEQFDIYIKTVIDIKTRICVAGMDRHYEGEELLLKNGSKQSNIWGGGIDVSNQIVDFNSFINIRPNDNNTSNEIQDAEIRKTYEKLTKHFFKDIYDR